MGSKKKENKPYLSGLGDKIERINKEVKPITGFVITRGDEIQGMLEGKPMDTVFKILSEVCPLKFRFGIGFGTIDSEIKENPGEMMGVAFEYAREALDKIKGRGCLFRIKGDFSGSIVELVNENLVLMSELLKRWDCRTFRRFELYRKYGTIYKVAEVEGVSPEAINKYINRYSIKQIIHSIDKIDKLFVD